MKILYLHQYFHTPEQGGAIRSYHLAKALVEAGHEVHLITAYNHPKEHTTELEGIHVHYLPVYYENKLKFRGRLLSFVKFMYRAYRKANSIPAIDVCYATSTPLTIGLIAIWLKRFRRIPFYFEVRDLWPEAPVQMGVIKNYFIKKYLYYLERTIYRKAEKIIALSPGIADVIQRLEPKKKITLIPNFADCEFFFPEEKYTHLMQKFNVENKFVISYFGAIGRANHLDYLIEAAKAIADRGNSEIQFLIAGNGSELQTIKAKVRHYNLMNVQFVGFINKKNLLELLHVTDAVYISFITLPIMETNSPNKFFDGLAAGKLIISTTKGWTKDLVEANDCGFYYDPENTNEFLSKLLPYIQDALLLKRAQTNARLLAENSFSKKEMVRRFLDLF